MPACLPAHTRPMGHKATFLIITLLSYVNQWTEIVKKQHCLQQYGRVNLPDQSVLLHKNGQEVWLPGHK